MKDRRTFFLSAFKYVVPVDYEKWFEGLAAEGWHPLKVGQWNSLVMLFQKGERKQYRYVVDMQPFPGKDYKPTYEEFGWEFVGQMASAYVWRREYEGERPESFSDTDSRQGRNRRFISAASVSFIMFLVCGTGFAAGAVFSSLETSVRLQFGIISVLGFAASAAIGHVMRKIRKNIDK